MENSQNKYINTSPSAKNISECFLSNQKKNLKLEKSIIQNTISNNDDFQNEAICLQKKKSNFKSNYLLKRNYKTNREKLKLEKKYRNPKNINLKNIKKLNNLITFQNNMNKNNILFNEHNENHNTKCNILTIENHSKNGIALENISLFKKKITKRKRNMVYMANENSYKDTDLLNQCIDTKNDNNTAKKIKLNIKHMLQDCKYEFKHNNICENKNNIAFELNIIFEK